MKSRWISPPKLHKSWLAAIWISFAGVSGILMIHTSSLDWGNVYQKESAVLEVIRGQFPYNSTGGLLIAPASWMPEDDNQETPVELVFQYQAPEAGEVSLIWGVNGWTPVAKELQPAGTVIKNSVMHTPMSPQGELFIASVQVPKGASVEYGFLISKSRDGAVTSVWEEDPGWPKLPRLLEARVVEIESEVHPGLRQESPGWAEILRLLFMWVGGALAVVFTYRRMSLLNEKKAAYILLGLVVLSGFLIRLNGAYAWNDTHPKVVEWLIGDEPQYDQLARGLLQGSGFSWPGRVPGYLLWLAGIYALTGGDYSAVPYAQILLGMATILLTYLIGWRILGRLVGLLAAFWVSVSYVLIHQAFHWLSEVLYTPIVLVVALLLWKAIQHPSTARFVWTGFVVGISNLIRPTLFFFPVFLVLLLIIKVEKEKVIKYWLVTIAISSIVVTPWVVHNYWRFGAIFPLQTSNAILWQGSPEYYHLTHDQGYTYMDIWTQVLYGKDWQLHDPNSIAGDRYWTARALRSISAEPSVYLKFAAEKMLTYWVGDPAADWGSKPVFSYTALRQLNYSPRDSVDVMLARILPLLALLSTIVLRKKFWLLSPVYFLLLYFNILHALTHAEVRLSEPLQPLLLILIAGATASLLKLDPGFQAEIEEPSSLKWLSNS